jgi:pimeloyl-ACP methyl ester carboxylesterase
MIQANASERIRMHGGVTARSTSFAAQGVTLAADRFEVNGAPSKGCLLLLHGGGQTRHSWDGSAREFAGRGWRVYTVDARGHGESEWAPDGDYAPDAMIADLRAVVSALGEKPVLVGASMGAMISLVGQGEHSDLARAVVLVDWVPSLESAGVARIMRFMTSASDGFSSLEEAAAAVRAYNPHRSQQGGVAGLTKNLRQRANGRWYWHWDPAFMRIPDEPSRAVALPRARAAAERIAVPLLLVRGKQSDVVSDDGVAEFLRLVPHARYVDVSGAGHMVAGDDNAVFSAAVTGFLEELDC